MSDHIDWLINPGVCVGLLARNRNTPTDTRIGEAGGTGEHPMSRRRYALISMESMVPKLGSKFHDALVCKCPTKYLDSQKSNLSFTLCL